MVGIRVCEPSLPNVPIPPPKKQFPYQQKENGFWNISFASYLCDGGFLFVFTSLSLRFLICKMESSKNAEFTG